LFACESLDCLGQSAQKRLFIGAFRETNLQILRSNQFSLFGVTFNVDALDGDSFLLKRVSQLLAQHLLRVIGGDYKNGRYALSSAGCGNGFPALSDCMVDPAITRSAVLGLEITNIFS